ncbi:MAG: GNAT family N-acetyltransferase [Sphingomonadaceae bacterium]|nr:GNAT family N-acetyltransferase [Sphingomonadaceae bacterium]
MTHGAPAWRPMRQDDLPLVKAMSDAIHGVLTEAQAVYAEKLALHPSGCFLFEVQGEAAGYLFAHPWLAAHPPKLDAMLDAIPVDADCLYLHDLALMPEARGSGAGRAALTIVRADAMRIGMSEIRLIAVGGADSFWRALGFADIGAADPSYGTGACAMQLKVVA